VEQTRGVEMPENVYYARENQGSWKQKLTVDGEYNTGDQFCEAGGGRGKGATT